MGGIENATGHDKPTAPAAAVAPASATPGATPRVAPSPMPTTRAPAKASAAAVVQAPSSAKPKRTVRVRFPPTTLPAFRALAATGDANAVREIASSTYGQPSCPTPTIYVTVPPDLTGRALQTDLAAFFESKGLTASPCQAFVYAFHSRADYQANQNNGYTAGRVALTSNSGSQRNLEVDVGNVYDYPAQFNFDYNA